MTIIATMSLVQASDGTICEAEELGREGKPSSGFTLTAEGSPISDRIEEQLRQDGWIIGDQMARPVQAGGRKIQESPNDPMTDDGDSRKAVEGPEETQALSAPENTKAVKGPDKKK